MVDAYGNPNERGFSMIWSLAMAFGLVAVVTVTDHLIARYAAASVEVVPAQVRRGQRELP